MKILGVVVSRRRLVWQERNGFHTITAFAFHNPSIPKNQKFRKANNACIAKARWPRLSIRRKQVRTSPKPFLFIKRMDQGIYGQALLSSVKKTLTYDVTASAPHNSQILSCTLLIVRDFLSNKSPHSRLLKEVCIASIYDANTVLVSETALPLQSEVPHPSIMQYMWLEICLLGHESTYLCPSRSESKIPTVPEDDSLLVV